MPDHFMEDGVIVREQAPHKEEDRPPLGSLICKCNMYRANLTPAVGQLLQHRLISEFRYLALKPTVL
jgi:hypothetical protein